MKSLAQKNAIVTGAAKGIGRAIALKLATDGFNVVVNYANSKTEAHHVVAEIEQAGGRAIAVQADVSIMSEFSELFSISEQAYGKIDVLVNNAGVSQIGLIADSTDEIFDYLFNTNVRGTVNGLKLSVERLNKGGKIINFSSTAVAASTPGMGLYAGSKAAVEAITRIFAKELKGKDISVNAIAPGLIRSEMFFEGKTEEQIELASKASPLQRLGEIEEIANAVSFLVSENASWINGQSLRVNGGVI